MIIPFVPGGSIDTVGRRIAEAWSVALRQQIVVDNRGGAGGNVGTSTVAHATPDGYTMLYGNLGPLAIGPHLYRKLDYDVAKQLAPVSLVGSSPFILFSSTKLPVQSVQELVAYGKSRPGQLNYASSGVGSGLHLAAELFKSAAGRRYRPRAVQRSGTGMARHRDRSRAASRQYVSRLGRRI